MCPTCGSRDFDAQPQQASAPLPKASANAGPGPKFGGNRVPSVFSNRKLMAIVAGVFLISIVLIFAGIQHSKKVAMEMEIRKQEELARIEIERQRQAMELEIEIKRQQEEEARRVEEARQSEERAREHRQAAARRDLERSAIEKMEIKYRTSLMDAKTRVVILRNIDDTDVRFNLKCCTVNNSCKTIYVSVPAHQETEIGFLEGWDGNFVSGERIEAHYQDAKLWQSIIP